MCFLDAVVDRLTGAKGGADNAAHVESGRFFQRLEGDARHDLPGHGLVVGYQDRLAGRRDDGRDGRNPIDRFLDVSGSRVVRQLRRADVLA